MSAVAEPLRGTRVELAHARLQLRIFQITLSLTMLFSAFEPAIIILQVPGSMLQRVASMSGNRELVAQAYFFCGFLMLPHALMHLFHPRISVHRQITKMGCLGLAGLSLCYVLMAWLSQSVDALALTSVLTRQSLGPMGYALALALALNTEQARTMRMAPA
jgi:hypothetical protein